jgi:hypothetical protein
VHAARVIVAKHAANAFVLEQMELLALDVVNAIKMRRATMSRVSVIKVFPVHNVSSHCAQLIKTVLLVAETNVVLVIRKRNNVNVTVILTVKTQRSVLVEPRVKY